MDNNKSFYDFDYIIELGEKRVEQYIGAYQSILGRMTNIILIYSVLGIYLVPIVLDLSQIPSFMRLPYLIYIVSTACFVGFLVASIVFTVRLLLPVDITYFQMSSVYYQDLRLEYEGRIFKDGMTEDEKKEAQATINTYLKASYIDELIRSQSNNAGVLRRKGSFYFNALVWGLVAVLPYALCVGFHVTKKVDPVQKVELIYPKKIVP